MGGNEYWSYSLKDGGERDKEERWNESPDDLERGRVGLVPGTLDHPQTTRKTQATVEWKTLDVWIFFVTVLADSRQTRHCSLTQTGQSPSRLPSHLWRDGISLPKVSCPFLGPLKPPSLHFPRC